MIKIGRHIACLDLTTVLHIASARPESISDLRMRRGQTLGFKANGYSFRGPGAWDPTWEGKDLAELAAAAESIGEALFEAELTNKPGPKTIPTIVNELLTRAGVHKTRLGVLGRIGDWIRAAGHGGPCRVFKSKGTGSLFECDLKDAYPYAAKVAWPGWSWRGCTGEFCRKLLILSLAAGIPYEPSHRWLAWIQAKPPKVEHLGQSIAPFPTRRKSGRLSWLALPWEGPAWDADCEVAVALGWDLNIKRGFCWRVDKGPSRVFEQLATSKLSPGFQKALALRLIGYMAYPGSLTDAVIMPNNEDIGEGWTQLRRDLDIWEKPKPEDKRRWNRFHRPHVAHAIWAWSRRELFLSLRPAILAGSLASIHVDCGMVADVPIQNHRMRVKSRVQGDWEIPYPGALRVNGVWQKRPGKKR